MTLVDVGVWFAAVWSRQVHHGIAKAWFDERSEPVVMCRVAQMGLLRLLSNQPVMGVDVLKRKDAWRVVDQLRADDRVRWSDEPAELETAWRVISARNDVSHKLWTDDYFAAFAQAADIRFTTLDKKFAKRYPSIQVETLG